MKINIELNCVNDAVLFVSKCNEYDCDIDYLYNPRYILDAKSIISVIGAGLNKTCSVILHTENKEIQNKFLSDIELWRV